MGPFPWKMLTYVLSRYHSRSLKVEEEERWTTLHYTELDLVRRHQFALMLCGIMEQLRWGYLGGICTPVPVIGLGKT